MQRHAVSLVCALAARVAVIALLVRTERSQAQEPPVVVFFAPQAMTSGTRTTLEDALSTQLSLLHATLHYETSPPASSSALEPVERLQLAKETADTQQAVAVFWLELPSAGPWLLYAVDARAERMMMRPLAAHDQSPEADIEALALIVRATTDALLHGEPIPATADARITEAASAAATAIDSTPRPATVEEPTQPQPAAAGLRITGAYVGTTFAKQRPWLNGFSLRAAWLWAQGPYVGVGFLFTPAIALSEYPARFELSRYPLSVHGGMRFVAGSFTFATELGLELELRNRRTLSASDTYEPVANQLKGLLNISPRIEVQVAITPWLIAFTGVGVDLVAGNFSYTVPVAGTSAREYLLEPHWFRLALYAGLGIMR